MKEMLITIDINPLISLTLLCLDPNSVIDDDILFNGWNNTIITANPLNEWKDYLNKGSNWATKKSTNRILIL